MLAAAASAPRDGKTTIPRLRRPQRRGRTAGHQRYDLSARIDLQDRDTSGWEGQLSATDRGDETLARFVAGLSTNIQLAPADAAWSYDNAGFGITGRVIELVTGKTFSDAVNDRVFQTAGEER
jgi:hypothetical protein